MKYNCILCKYETTDKCAWYHHKKTQKHILNEENEKNKKIENLEKYQIMLDEKDKQLYDKEKQLIEKNKQISKLTDLYEKQIATLKDFIEKQQLDKNSQSTQINKCVDIIGTSNDNIATIANKTLSVAQYLTNKYPDAPPLEEPNYKFIKGAFESYAAIKQIGYPASQIIYNFTKNKLADYIADVITNTYRKYNEPEKQSFWSTDVARKSFKVKQITDNIDQIVEKTNWITDKTGKIIGNKLTTKCLDYVKRIVSAYLKKLAEKVDTDFINMSEGDINCLGEGKKLLNKLQQKTYLCELETNIIKQIAPNFYLDRSLDI